MTQKFGQHSRKAVASGKVELPPELAYLQRIKYTRIAERIVDRKRIWCVEVKGSWLKDLVTVKRRLVQAQRKMLSVMKENERVANEALAQANEMEKLQRVNAQLMKNIDEDRYPDRFVRSPKNYHIAAEERAFTPTSSRPLQGGSAGLEKK